METETETNSDGEAVSGVEAMSDADMRDVHPDDRPQVDAIETDEGTGDADTPEAGAVADDDEEVEHNGKKYRVPKAFQAERLMHADYTKKTTDLAETRRAWEAQRVQADAADETERAEHGRAYSLKEQMKLFDAVDWQGLNASDPVEAQSLWFEREQAKSALAELEGQLQQKGDARLRGQREALATAMQETGRVLSRDIPGWTPQVANAIADFGIKEFGIEPAEIRAMSDPRVWKALHRAMTAEASLAKAKAGERQATIQKVTPAKRVGAGAAPTITGPDDRQSGAAWQRAREAQIAARR